MNNKTVPVKWLEQRKNRSGEVEGHSMNMFYVDKTIYSYGYHFPIARITDSVVEGRTVILFTTRGYSVSTSKHISYTRGAINDNYIVIEVEDPSSGLVGAVAQLQARIVEYQGKLKRARLNKDIWQHMIDRVREQLGYAQRLEATV